MIISASRRCDIPKYQKKWFLDIMKQGFVETKNPFNAKQIKKIPLNKENIDLFIFWTKDATDFTDVLEYLNDNGIKFLIQYTLNDYPKDIEPYVPDINKLTDNFNFINSKYQNSVLWRYDPIILTKSLDIHYHEEKFNSIFKKISKSTKICYTSFFDIYRKNKKFINEYNVFPENNDNYELVLARFDNIINNSDLKIIICSEFIDINKYNNIIKGACIDRDYLEKYYNLNFPKKKDTGQRKNCNCVKSSDIGTYNICKMGCKYCYATNNN